MGKSKSKEQIIYLAFSSFDNFRIPCHTAVAKKDTPTITELLLKWGHFDIATPIFEILLVPCRSVGSSQAVKYWGYFWGTLLLKYWGC